MRLAEKKGKSGQVESMFHTFAHAENKMYTRSRANRAYRPRRRAPAVGTVLASPGFLRNEAKGRFLRFLSERHLEANDNQLKESVIAVEVLGASRTRSIAGLHCAD